MEAGPGWTDLLYFSMFSGIPVLEVKTTVQEHWEVRLFRSWLDHEGSAFMNVLIHSQMNRLSHWLWHLYHRIESAVVPQVLSTRLFHKIYWARNNPETSKIMLFMHPPKFLVYPWRLREYIKLSWINQIIFQNLITNGSQVGQCTTIHKW